MTAELAVAMPAVTLFLAAVVTVGSLVLTQVRCQDAARAGARWAARGESPADVRRVAAQAAPTGAGISITSAAEVVTVRVSAPVTSWWGSGAGGLRVTATATAAREPVR